MSQNSPIRDLSQNSQVRCLTKHGPIGSIRNCLEIQDLTRKSQITNFFQNDPIRD